MMPSAESIPVEPPPDKDPPPRGKYSCTWFPGTQDVLSGKSLGGVNVVTFCRRRVGCESSPRESKMTSAF